jgi:hypothetical protein
MAFGTETECTMTYKLVGSDQSFSGACLHLDGADILFKTDRAIETGKALEIRLSLDQTGAQPMTAFIEVTRSTAAEDQTYEVAASIKGIKAN